MKLVDIIGLIASIITILALLWKVYFYCYNCYYFWKGGIRESFHSGAYRIKGFGVNGKVIYEHNPNGNGYVSYATVGMQMRPYIIKPFKEWKFLRSFDDIRVPDYPIESL